MTQYLIWHKVRGEPAFDIAERIQIGDEEGWIIPTSGHRAYPIDHWPLDKACPMTKAVRVPYNFDDWPDHYQIEKKEPKQTVDVDALVNGLRQNIGFLRRA